MSPRSAGRPWLLYAALVLVLGATLLFFLSDGNPSLQRAAVCIFVVAAVVYVIARLAMIAKDRAE